MAMCMIMRCARQTQLQARTRLHHVFTEAWQARLHGHRFLFVLVRGKRTKAKHKLAYGKNRNDPTELALKHFDQNYRPLFGETWPSIRLALLSMPSSGALVNNYSDVQPTVERLQSLGARDFVQPCAARVARLHRVKQTGGFQSSSDLSKVEGKDSSDVRDGCQEENAAADSRCSDARVDDVHKAEELQQHDIAKRAAENEEEEANAMGSLEFDRTQDTSTGGEGPTGKAWWEDKYIVAPGYEHRMDQMERLELEERLLDTQSSGDADIRIIHGNIRISPNVRCFVHEDGPKRLPPAKKGTESPSLQYYILDAASVLPVLAMDIGPGDAVLDLCAGPGGKSLVILQTMLVGSLIANEMVTSRRGRLQQVFRAFLPGHLQTSGAVQTSGLDGRHWGEVEPASYDRVLVDVPCSTDRVSATEPDNNLFKVNRSKERWNLPQLQAALLSAGIQAARPGGTIVYSTCTMSPLQNDSVVQTAIARCREEFDIGADVVDLSTLARGFKDVFHFHPSCRYGQLVAPRITANYGPMYFARLQRTT